MRTIALIALLTGAAFGQSPEAAPRFEIADVHASPKSTGIQARFGRFSPPSGGRYEVKNASMVDLISNAWGYGDDKVLGGPSWLEMDRFDITAKLPPDSTRDTQKLMLQTLLEERFGLKVRKEMKPLPTYALVVGKKNQMKPGDGEGETGCKPESKSAPGPMNGGMIMMAGRDGAAPVTMALGPGGEVLFHCRNVSMKAFVEEMQGLPGSRGSLGTNPILDETHLEGRWNFDVKWSILIGPMMNGSDRITVFDAVEKQLGLKLEKREVPTPVLVVESVNRKPTDNPPNLAEVLPPVVPPTEFEVAEVKPSQPGGRGGAFRFQPGGRVTAENRSMSLLLMRAFGTQNMMSEELVGVPSWANSVFFDIAAKAPSAGNPAAVLNFDTAAPLLRQLFAERFGLKYHTENRPLTAYTLVAVKPKLKKADPDSRTWCRNEDPPPGAPPGSWFLKCQNATMAEFADHLQGMTQELKWPVLDATGIEGRWDLSLSFSQDFGARMAVAGGGRGGPVGGPPGGDLAPSDDPSGVITIFQAIEKQLGLKLEAQKRFLPVTVIDHLEQKPTDN
jgi:uncharacterized protein (TIGR03435 family)